MVSYSIDMNLSKLWEFAMIGKPAMLQSMGSQSMGYD